MIKLYRGDVIRVNAPDGKGGLKERYVVVFQNTPKNSDVISVYCTSQNNGDDEHNIFVKLDSDDGKEMGITKDTYIRPKKIFTIPAISVIRKVGRCSLINLIQNIVDKIMSK